MLERQIEQSTGAALKKFCGLLGVDFYYLKLNVIGIRAFPDRLLLWSGANIQFIEFKREGQVPRANQLIIHKILRRMGFTVHVFDNRDLAVETIKKEILSTTGAGQGN